MIGVTMIVLFALFDRAASSGQVACTTNQQGVLCPDTATKCKCVQNDDCDGNTKACVGGAGTLLTNLVVTALAAGAEGDGTKYCMTTETAGGASKTIGVNTKFDKCANTTKCNSATSGAKYGGTDHQILCLPKDRIMAASTAAVASKGDICIKASDNTAIKCDAGKWCTNGACVAAPTAGPTAAPTPAGAPAIDGPNPFTALLTAALTA